MSKVESGMGQAVNRMNGKVGGKAGQHSSFYDQVDNSTSRETGDVDNGKRSGGMPDQRFPHATAPSSQK